MKFYFAILAAGITTAAAEDSYSYSYSYSYSDHCPEVAPTSCDEAGVWVVCECSAQMEEGGEMKECVGRCADAIDNINVVCSEGDVFFDVMSEEEGTYDPIAFDLFVKENVPVCEGAVEAPPAIIIKATTTTKMDIKVPTAEEQADEDYMHRFALGVESGIHEVLLPALSDVGAFAVELKSVDGVEFNEPGSRRLLDEVDVVYDVVVLVKCDGDCEAFATGDGVDLGDSIKAGILSVDVAELGSSIVDGLSGEGITIPALTVGDSAVDDVEVEVNEPEPIETDAPTVTPATSAPTASEEVDGGASAVAAGASAAVAVAVAAVALF